MESKAAQRLYHGYAATLPIIDYHNHLPPKEIAENKQFSDLTDIWLRGDHYKWRAMRALGVSEHLITGGAAAKEKFHAFAACVPYTLRNPLFHWVHMELQNPFGIKKYLNADTADEIYSACQAMLGQERFTTRGLLQHFNVEMVCTTDDPCDDLSYHQSTRAGNFKLQLLPGFRPDKVLAIGDRDAFFAYLQRLEVASGTTINDFDALLAALQQRVDHFSAVGCRIADHGLIVMPSHSDMGSEVRAEFKKFISTKGATPFSQPDHFAGALLIELCKMYHAKGWVQQFHLGAMRNNNSRQYKTIGADSGYDSIGDYLQAQNLARFLSKLDEENALAKTILYNLNPADNEVFATMAGNFNDGSVKGKIQFGSGWWFLDQLDGMEKQINALSSMGILSTFVGMLTDSRSFLSFSRHEYFRRLLCNIFGREMEKGLLPNDERWVGGIIKDICYHNAKAYFNC